MNMQADRTLTEGHYRAIASEALVGQATHEGVMNIIDSIGDDLDFKKKQAGNYDAEIVKKFNLGFIVQNSTLDIYSKIKRLLVDQELVESFGENAKKYAKQNSWVVTAKKFI